MKREIIQKIVKASGVVSGELVLIHFWGEDAEKTIANEFMIAVAAMGATPVLLQEARSIHCAMFQQSTGACFGEGYFSLFSGFDTVLDLFAYQPVVLGEEIPEDAMERYRTYMAQLFSALMKAKRFVQIRLPTEANAVESGLETADYMERMERAYDIDYHALLAACVHKKEKLADSRQLVLHTGQACQLFFDLSCREWHIDAGDGDWPCGEIYIAPNETKTEGSVFFDRLWIESAGVYDDVTLFVAHGKIVSSDNEEVASYLRQLSPEDVVVCELGLGMNRNITDLCGYAVLDEKMAGTFHIAIGANNMFGGQNAASIHMDFVGSGSYSLQKI